MARMGIATGSGPVSASRRSISPTRRIVRNSPRPFSDPARRTARKLCSHSAPRRRIDNVITQILDRRPATSIAEAIDMMASIDGTLPDADGLKWFNRLYLRVTEAVAVAVAAGVVFQDPPFLERLDIVFANLYFDAAAAGDVTPSSAPSAWAPLFAARHQLGISRLQFALAGMNAHINRDLPDALVKTHLQLGGMPLPRGPRHADFDTVNGLLERVEAQVKTEFLTGAIGVIDAAAGTLDDVAAMWSVRKARELAWTNAQVLWQLRPLPALSAEFFARLDSLTGCTGRGFLVRVNRPAGVT